MSLWISALCFVLVCLVGVWGGVVLRMHYEKTSQKHTAKLIIVTDSVDGTRYAGIELSRTTLETVQHGDRIMVDVEVRQ